MRFKKDKRYQEKKSINLKNPYRMRLFKNWGVYEINGRDLPMQKPKRSNKCGIMLFFKEKNALNINWT